MGLLDFMKTTAETAEIHGSKELRTHYYKSGYKQVKEYIKEFAQLQKIDIRNINDDHGEIYLQDRNFHMIISVIQLNPRETAVDVKTSTYGLVGFGKPVKLIHKLYTFLNNKMDFKGVGLHP